MIQEGGDYYLAYGGGLGDVVWDYTHDDTAGCLQWLTETCRLNVSVITQCHNSGVSDVFLHHPYITEHTMEEWNPPTVAEASRLSNILPDGRRPLQREHLPYGVLPDQPQLYLTDAEKTSLRALLSGLTVVVQPFAGNASRDAFTSESLERAVDFITALVPEVRFLVVGQDHGRLTDKGESQRREEIHFTRPNVVNLIGTSGIRMNYHLALNCSAFIGAFSNLVRTAWDGRRPTVVPMDSRVWREHIPQHDVRYTYGWSYGEVTRIEYRTGDSHLNIPAVARPIVAALRSPDQPPNAFSDDRN